MATYASMYRRSIAAKSTDVRCHAPPPVLTPIVALIRPTYFGLLHYIAMIKAINCSKEQK